MKTSKPNLHFTENGISVNYLSKKAERIARSFRLNIADAQDQIAKEFTGSSSWTNMLKRSWQYVEGHLDGEKFDVKGLVQKHSDREYRVIDLSALLSQSKRDFKSDTFTVESCLTPKLHGERTVITEYVKPYFGEGEEGETLSVEKNGPGEEIMSDLSRKASLLTLVKAALAMSSRVDAMK